MVGRPVSRSQRVSGRSPFDVAGVIYRACTLIKPVELAEPKSIPLNVVFSEETFRLRPAGYGVSAVLEDTSETVYS